MTPEERHENARRIAQERRNARAGESTPPQEIARPEAPQRGGTWRGGGPVTPAPVFEEVVEEFDNRTETTQYRGPGRKTKDVAGFFVIYK